MRKDYDKLAGVGERGCRDLVKLTHLNLPILPYLTIHYHTLPYHMLSLVRSYITIECLGYNTV